MRYTTESSHEGEPSSLALAADNSDIVSQQLWTGGLYRLFVKRLCDIIVIVLAAPIILPTILVLALLIRNDGGPAFYVQDRIGKGGRLFRCWKLRSMVLDAESVLAVHLARYPEAREEWTTYQKLKADPRITPIGRFLRKTSLDELPQLWSVLKGDMSLVGPRPMLPEQRMLYPNPGQAYYRLRPGMTGFWQISARNGARFVDRARYDSQYYHRLSFSTDVLVLIATIPVVLRGTGQ